VHTQAVRIVPSMDRFEISNIGNNVKCKHSTWGKAISLKHTHMQDLSPLIKIQRNTIYKKFNTLFAVLDRFENEKMSLVLSTALNLWLHAKLKTSGTVFPNTDLLDSK